MDPPGSRMPPPPPPPSVPDDDAGGEDEDNRKTVDFGDIDYADINLFYNLPSNTTVSYYYCYYLKLLLVFYASYFVLYLYFCPLFIYACAYIYPYEHALYRYV